MIEIRPVLAEEAEAFLQLLCRVFELDVDRARGVFFAEPLFDLRRKWGLFESGVLQSILTTVPLQFGWGAATGIAGVATRPEARCLGLAERLLRKVVESSQSRGEQSVFLFATQPNLYERVGFQVLDHVVRGDLCVEQEGESGPLLDYGDVRNLYSAWALEDPNRLARDDKRWEYWRWNLRICRRAPGGYYCIDGHVVREAVCNRGLAAWACRPGEEWCGLESMTEQLQVPTQAHATGTFLMGYGAAKPPELFMTDQF